MPSLAQLAPLLLLPLLAWFALDAFDATPRPGQQPVFARVLRSSGGSGGVAAESDFPVVNKYTPEEADDGQQPDPVAVALRSPPPPLQPDYWQKVGRQAETWWHRPSSSAKHAHSQPLCLDALPCSALQRMLPLRDSP